MYLNTHFSNRIQIFCYHHDKTPKRNVFSTALAVLFTLVDSGIDVVGSTIYPGYSFNCSKLLNRVESITQTRPEEMTKREKGEKEEKGEKREKFVKLVKPKHYNNLSAAGAQAAVCLKFGGRLSHDVNCHSINFILVFWIITLRQPCGATSIFDGFIKVLFSFFYAAIKCLQQAV